MALHSAYTLLLGQVPLYRAGHLECTFHRDLSGVTQREVAGEWKGTSKCERLLAGFWSSMGLGLARSLF